MRKDLTRPPVAPTDVTSRAQAMVLEMMSMGPQEVDVAIQYLRGLGEGALPVLASFFPGLLWVQAPLARRRLPAGRDVSPVAAALVAFGDGAVPYVRDLLTSGTADSKYCAALVAHDLAHDDLVPALGQLLFTEDEALRQAAARAVRRTPTDSRTVELRASLEETALYPGFERGLRMRAARALGELRDESTLPSLVELLSSDDSTVAATAHRHLVRLTGHDLGPRRPAWDRWAREHGHRNRVEWLVVALRTHEPAIHAVAFEEIVLATGVDFGTGSAPSRAERMEVTRRYEQWWEAEGRARFGDRRRAARVSVRAPVQLEGEDCAGEGESEDIGAGGLFVVTDVLCPVGAPVELSLALPDGTAVQAKGEVRWHRNVRPPARRGMGIRFRWLPPNAKSAIERFVRQQLG